MEQQNGIKMKIQNSNLWKYKYLKETEVWKRLSI